MHTTAFRMQRDRSRVPKPWAARRENHEAKLALCLFSLGACIDVQNSALIGAARSNPMAMRFDGRSSGSNMN